MDNNMRIPRVEYAEVLYVIDGAQIIDGSQIITGDGEEIFSNGETRIYGSQVMNDGQFPEGGQIIGSYIIQGAQMASDSQNNLYSTNSIGSPGLPGNDSASMGPSSNQSIILNSVPYVPNSFMNTNAAFLNNNNELEYSIMSTTGGGTGNGSPEHSGLPEDVELKFDTPQEMANVENFVLQDMPDVPNFDINNFDLYAMNLGDDDNFPGLDFKNINLSRESSIDLVNSAVNPNAVQQQANTSSGVAPCNTIRTKKIRMPRKKNIKEELTPITISSSSYPPLEMLGINIQNSNQESNETVKYNTPIPYTSPNYHEESLPSRSYSSPVSPSSSTSSCGSDNRTHQSSRVNLATMTESQRYRHIREQNNESSRAYRERKKMTMKESEAELLQLQERNTRLKEVFQSLKQKKDISHELMRGFVRDCSNRKNM